MEEALKTRLEVLQSVFDELTNYLLDNCHPDVYWEDFDPDIDDMRTEVNRLIEEEHANVAQPVS